MHCTHSLPTSCTNHPDQQLQIANALFKLYTDPDLSRFSYNIVPCYRENVNNDKDMISGIKPVFTPKCRRHSQVDQNCKFPEYSGVVDNSLASKHGSRTCPWSYRVDYNEMRIPSQIATVVCECKHCHRGRCVPIMSYIPILLIHCNKKTKYFDYTPSILEVSTGCACAQHKLANFRKGSYIARSSRTRFIMEQ